MNARPKKKMCWNCEENVSLKAETCPYCGVSVIGLSSEITSEAPTPPYRLVNPSHEQTIPASPYLDEDISSSHNVEEQEVKANSQENEPATLSHGLEDNSKQIVLIMSFLLAGSVFFIFGFALLLFSSEGYLSLHWDAAHWFVYLILSLPLLYVGFKRLNTLSE